jgi:UDP-N-acetylglucosamine 2-epimerase (non-hydrolysing)
MTDQRHIAVVIGTRPEAVKLLPVIDACERTPGLRTTFVATAQHRDMLDQVTAVWGRKPDVDLNVMQANQDLTDVTSAVLKEMRTTLGQLRPDVLVVQGDTTTTFAAALAAFYAGPLVAHVEAGLRTWNKRAPFPEEINRQLTTSLADIHFAPTEASRENLLRCGICPENILVTGNTGIDALFAVRKRVQTDSGLRADLEKRYSFLHTKRPLLLVTAHRRESFGGGFEEICQGIRSIAHNHPDLDIVYPVHLNPSVREPVNRLLTGNGFGSSLHLLSPVSYLDLVYLLDRAHIVLTDSGGIQEEAPAFGKPVLVMRTVTERPEAVECGSAKLVGADRRAISENVSRLLTDDSAYAAMAKPRFPFGDGTAATKIAEALAKWPSRQRG